MHICNMDHEHDCDHTHCRGASANTSVCQTLSEMDWERGLWYAAFNGDRDRVQTLIDKSSDAKAAVNAQDNSGYTPLHYAARKGYIDICKILLQNGAKIDAETKSGKATPLHKAAAAGKLEMVMFLIKSGASVDTQDIDGQSALHKAFMNKHFGLISALVDACSHLTELKDNKGHIATEYMPSAKD